MTRILEVLVSCVIVLLLAVVVAVFLPSHGHVERSVEVSSPLRQIYDSLNTFRRYPEWGAVRGLDPQVQINFDGPESGEGARVMWTSPSRDKGNGSLEITSSETDSRIQMAIDNDWSGMNKTYTITLTPSENGKTVQIGWAYDADYGWNLLWRYAGLYIHGDPATHIQVNLNNVAAMLASFPNVDYKDQAIGLTDIVQKPLFLVSTKAPRTLDAVAEATDAAMAEIEAAMKKAGVHAAGPRMTITTNFGDENYVFDVAVPVDATRFKIGDTQVDITLPVLPDLEAENTTDTSEPDAAAAPATPATPKAGDRDDDGYLVVDGPVRALLWYQGKALVTDYAGNPAALPLLRRMEKAYAETHGYPYSEMDEGRFWDELTSPPDAPEDQQTYKVYLPVMLGTGDEAGTGAAGMPANDGMSPPPDSTAPQDGSPPPDDGSGSGDPTEPPADGNDDGSGGA
jgi:uncharacterized protein YndB with AHSA1/START domain